MSDKHSKCSVSGCDSKVRAKGLCNKHYQRLLNHGDPLAFKSKRVFGCKVDGCKGKHRALGYCQKHYSRLVKTGVVETVKLIVGNDKDRLLSSIEKTDSGCWLWKKRIHAGGYGVTWLGGRLEMAHRASWMVFVGDIPEGMQLNHTCHNRACVNPSHLYVGTQIENMKDMRDAGRENKAKGERSGTAVLDAEKVLLIKKLIRDGVKQAEIADRFSVAPTTVSAIKNKKTWGWLE